MYVGRTAMEASDDDVPMLTDAQRKVIGTAFAMEREAMRQYIDEQLNVLRTELSSMSDKILDFRNIA